MISHKTRPVRWGNIDWLIGGEGDVSIGLIGGIRCAATATDAHSCLVMLVRRPRESLEDLLTRLDEAIRLAVEDDIVTDEINA